MLKDDKANLLDAMQDCKFVEAKPMYQISNVVNSMDVWAKLKC